MSNIGSVAAMPGRYSLFRYRAHVCDKETELYTVYLKSQYYTS